MANSSELSSGQLLFTFQSGYIQISAYWDFLIIRLELYIPIWLYSNGHEPNSDKLECSVFTFQSGYIQIMICQAQEWTACISLYSNAGKLN